MTAFVPQSRDYGAASEELLWWQACRLQLTNAADTAASTVINSSFEFRHLLCAHES
jgi:hypothetical protein